MLADGLGRIEGRGTAAQDQELLHGIVHNGLGRQLNGFALIQAHAAHRALALGRVKNLAAHQAAHQLDFLAHVCHPPVLQMDIDKYTIFFLHR